jgi:hypothetical protein
LLLTRIAATEKRYVVHADDKLTAFLELETAICEALPWQRPVKRQALQ